MSLGLLIHYTVYCESSDQRSNRLEYSEVNFDGTHPILGIHRLLYHTCLKAFESDAVLDGISNTDKNTYLMNSFLFLCGVPVDCS